MEDLLYLVHRIPYPPNKGDKIRSYHLLKHLAQRYRVHLGTFIDDPDDRQHVDTVRALCGDTHFAALQPRRAKLRSLNGMWKGLPLTLDYYRDGGLQAWVDRMLRQYPIKRIVVFSSAMAQYVEHTAQARRVIDFVDIDSDKWQQYANNKSWPMNWLYRRESAKLLTYERQVAAEFDASFFVSAAEAALFQKLAPESKDKVDYFNNGVNTEYFSAAQTFPTPFDADIRPIVFTGAMDYWPNIDAVQWFAHRVLPAVRQFDAGARFYIVGSRPGAEVQALARLPGIEVTGTVADVRPYIAHAALCVAPLHIARGIQNKVLEAMAMAKAVVVTPEALEGIDAQTGREILLAAGAEQFIAAVTDFLAHPEAEIGRRARMKVERQYGWQNNLKRLDALLGFDLPASASSAAVSFADPVSAQA